MPTPDRPAIPVPVSGTSRPMPLGRHRRIVSLTLPADLDACLSAVDAGVLGWTVRTPQGLIMADQREKHGWRVAVESDGCRVGVPDYAPAAAGYRLCLRDGDGGIHFLPFDVPS